LHRNDYDFAIRIICKQYIVYVLNKEPSTSFSESPQVNTCKLECITVDDDGDDEEEGEEKEEELNIGNVLDSKWWFDYIYHSENGKNVDTIIEYFPRTKYTTD
jgi:hypothetical protein